MILISSCSLPKSGTELEAKCEALMEMYPNFESNDMARNALNDSVRCYCESFVGKEATLLQGIEFNYLDSYENPDTGGYSALFGGREYCEIDAKGGKTKYISSDAQILVLGPVSDEMAVTLDKNQVYSLSGNVHTWDGDNLLGHTGLTIGAGISFGTFVLDSMNVNKIEK